MGAIWQIEFDHHQFPKASTFCKNSSLESAIGCIGRNKSPFRPRPPKPAAACWVGSRMCCSAEPARAAPGTKAWRNRRRVRRCGRLARQWAARSSAACWVRSWGVEDGAELFRLPGFRRSGSAHGVVPPVKAGHAGTLIVATPVRVSADR